MGYTLAGVPSVALTTGSGGDDGAFDKKERRAEKHGAAEERRRLADEFEDQARAFEGGKKGEVEGFELDSITDTSFGQVKRTDFSGSGGKLPGRNAAQLRRTAELAKTHGKDVHFLVPEAPPAAVQADINTIASQYGVRILIKIVR